jgi:hypothetical protein
MMHASTKASSSCALPLDRLTAPFFGGDVSHSFSERPLVAERILGSVLAFAVLEIGRLHHDLCAAGACRIAVSACVVHTHVGDDQRTVAKAQLQ